jgi:hypothetical protein
MMTATTTMETATKANLPSCSSKPRVRLGFFLYVEVCKHTVILLNSAPPVEKMGFDA